MILYAFRIGLFPFGGVVGQKIFEFKLRSSLRPRSIFPKLPGSVYILSFFVAIVRTWKSLGSKNHIQWVSLL